MSKVITSAKGTSKLGKILNKLGFKLEGSEGVVFVADTITIWRDSKKDRNLIVQHFINAEPNIYIDLAHNSETYTDVYEATDSIASHGLKFENSKKVFR